MRTRRTSSPPRRSEEAASRPQPKAAPIQPAVAHDAAEAEVTRRGLDHLGPPRRRPVAEAVVRRGRCEPPLITRREPLAGLDAERNRAIRSPLRARSRRGRTSTPRRSRSCRRGRSRSAGSFRGAMCPRARPFFRFCQGNRPGPRWPWPVRWEMLVSPGEHGAPETAAGRPLPPASVGSSAAHLAYACTSS